MSLILKCMVHQYQCAAVASISRVYIMDDDMENLITTFLEEFLENRL